MRLLWLADVLRAAGLTVHEYDGWRTRGLESFGPVRGIICHGTAGSPTSTDAGELRVIAITGSNTAAAPIAELYLSRSGEWWVVASGTCTGVKTGTAGPLEDYSDDAVLQIEAQHSTTEPWTETQYRSYVWGVAALCAYREPGYDVPVGRVVGHYEHQPTEKTDPWFDMVRFRADVAAVLNGDDMAEEWGNYPRPKGIGDRPWSVLLADIWGQVYLGGSPWDGARAEMRRTLDRLEASAAADQTRDAAMLAAIQALASHGGPEAAPIVEAIEAEGHATRELVEQRHQVEMAEAERRHQTEMAALRAERDAEVAELQAALKAREGAAQA